MARMKALDFLHRTAVSALIIFTAVNGVIVANNGFRLIAHNLNNPPTGTPATGPKSLESVPPSVPARTEKKLWDSFIGESFNRQFLSWVLLLLVFPAGLEQPVHLASWWIDWLIDSLGVDFFRRFFDWLLDWTDHCIFSNPFFPQISGYLQWGWQNIPSWSRGGRSCVVDIFVRWHPSA